MVGILQSTLFWYIAVVLAFSTTFTNVSDLKRFFFFSELVWLFVFVCLLGLNLVGGNPLIYANCFFVLVFTACEAVVLAAILLVASESSSVAVFDVSLFFLFQNIVILMLLFWLLSWVGDRFYKLKSHKSSESVYECGFTSTHALRVSINFGFFVIALLLILYDIEFLFLIPVYFNFTSLTMVSGTVYWVFIVFVALSFVVDWETLALKWIK